MQKAEDLQMLFAVWDTVKVTPFYQIGFFQKTGDCLPYFENSFIIKF
jgi:hypothetical protein